MDTIEIHEVDDMDIEIMDDDYVVSDVGALGCQYQVMQGSRRVIITNSSRMVSKAIIADMETQQYWPSAWYVNDHGNISSWTL